MDDLKYVAYPHWALDLLSATRVVISTVSGSPPFWTHSGSYFLVPLPQVWQAAWFYPMKYEQKWHVRLWSKNCKCYCTNFPYFLPNLAIMTICGNGASASLCLSLIRRSRAPSQQGWTCGICYFKPFQFGGCLQYCISSLWWLTQYEDSFYSID